MVFVCIFVCIKQKKMKNKDKQIAEYEELLKTLRSQLYDKENKETILTLAIKQVLDKWN